MIVTSKQATGISPSSASFRDIASRVTLLTSNTGVVPEYAGRGVGSLLLEWGLKKADEDDRAVYVTASPSGMRVYERAGFQAIYSGMVLEDERGGPLHLCTMYRPPKSERDQEKLLFAS